MFKSLDLLLHSEARARRYLIEKSWQKKRRFCIRCRSKKVYRLADKRYRCARCGYTFQEFAGRWIAELKISAAQWLWTLKLFELEVSYNRIADEIGISYPTVLKAIRLIRYAILQQYLGAKPRSAESVWHGILVESLGRAPAPAGNRGNGLVFSVEERNGTIDVAPVHNLSRATLLRNNLAMNRLGQVVYVAPYEKSRALMFWGGRRFASRRILSAGRTAAKTGLVEDFLVFTRERFARLPRISEQQFPLYLMEMKFRYDHRNRHLFDLLASAIAQLVPSR
ncbi:MAG: transposase [Candidatus Binatia bacterium]